MKMEVAENSNTSYRNNSILLMMWIYNNEELREEVLHDWMVEQMNRVDSLDQATNGTRRNCPTVRQAYKKALHDINKADNNCPIILCKLTFNMFSHYLTTRKNRKGSICPRPGMDRYAAV